ncbi:MAG: carbohydrate kinase family protein, partial [Fimbriimonadaceae bacterium]|nr:carbohydrate kinase family protein [Fimbriimonadaceae bacterium]
GGEAANTALILRSWGTDVILLGNRIGQGETAKMLRQLLEDSGLSTEFVYEDSGLAPVCDIYVTPDGERTMFGTGFTNLGQRTFPEDFTPTRNCWVTTDSNVSEAGKTFMLSARAAAAKLYWMDNLDLSLLQAGDLLQTSTDLAGKKGDIQANLSLVSQWVNNTEAFCILSDGANGFVGGSRSLGVRHFSPFPCSEGVDATGAGDAFRAGVLYGLDHRWPIEDCLRFGSAAGCLNCLSLGATTKPPTKQEVIELATNPVNC